jgi:hypothetical protein
MKTRSEGSFTIGPVQSTRAIWTRIIHFRTRLEDRTWTIRTARDLGRGRLCVAKLIYSAIASLDGYVADEEGKFDWGEPDEEVHSFINELDREVGTYLYGRRLYEVMVAWEDVNTHDQPPHMGDFAEIWRGADKVVYSKTLDAVTTPRTRIERNFDPEVVQRMKASAERDLSVGGPELAAHAFRGRFGRRVPPVLCSDRGGRREASPPERSPSHARADGRAPFRNGVCLSPLPLSEVTAGS